MGEPTFETLRRQEQIDLLGSSGLHFSSGFFNAGRHWSELEDTIEEALSRLGAKPKLALVFISPSMELEKVQACFRRVVPQAELIGCSSAGEFTEQGATPGSVAFGLLGGDGLEVAVTCSDRRGIWEEPGFARLFDRFRALDPARVPAGFLGRTLVLLAEGLSGGVEQLLNQIMSMPGYTYELVGGVAGDDARFERTFRLHNDSLFDRGFVCCEILTRVPPEIRFQHSWKPLKGPYRVSRASGMQVFEFNGKPAVRVYEQLAEEKGLKLTSGELAGFAMQHILGLRVGSFYKLRVPLRVLDDGSLICAAEVPEGAQVWVMEASREALQTNGLLALKGADLNDLGAVAGVLAFECVAKKGMRDFCGGPC